MACITYLDLMHTSDAPLASSPPHSAQNQSSPALLRVFRVTAVTSNTVSFQQETTADDSVRSGNASKVSNWFPLRLRWCVPSAEEEEEGLLRVRHVKMTRRETSSAPGCVCYMIFLPVFTTSGHIVAPENHNTLGFLNRQARVAMVTVRKNVLEYPG